MKIVNPSYEILNQLNKDELYKNIEKYGRVCYKSENKITKESAAKFVKQLIKNGHESVLEHEKLTIKIICDRGISHELVRHRIASYSQESTRYCNYGQDKFDNQITFVKPCYWEPNTPQMTKWQETMEFCEKMYLDLILNGSTPEQARTVLPHSLKTEIVITMNFRELRYFLKLRTSKKAHPQMKQITIPLLKQLKEDYETIFFDINEE